MRLTIVHPCIGRRKGTGYIRTWQMEPLPAAVIAGLTPREVEIRFYDDRMEPIPFDEPTDLVAISVETYTARRAYQIASEYRRRGVPVVMGGFHANLCPEEVAQYAEAVVTTEAEDIWPQVVEDAASGQLQTYYNPPRRPELAGMQPDRSLYKRKRYLPISLVEAGRGCRFCCEFCAIQTYFNQTQNMRPTEDILHDLEELPRRRLVFFVDDNFTSDINAAKKLLPALIPLKRRWVSQICINAAHDTELLELMAASGCQGVLIGFESLNAANLQQMDKKLNLKNDGYAEALGNLRRYNIRLYATFIFGYDEDTPSSIEETLVFALKHRFYIAAFNHLTPFPGTPLYKRLEKEGRLLYRRWWLDPKYRYNLIPFQPVGISPEELREGCVKARTTFFSWKNTLVRSLDPVNRSDLSMWASFWSINYALHREVRERDGYPLGDENWQGELIKVRENPSPVTSSDATMGLPS